jgi:hypothetical protein
MKVWMLMLLVCPVTVMAESGSTSYGAQNPATIMCFQVVTMLERSPKGAEQQFYSWAQGYFAGRRVSDPDLHELPAEGGERNKVFGKIVAHCEANPQSTYADAVRIFANRKN